MREPLLLCRLRITFSDHYPLDPPEFIFVPPSPEHMHIYSNGFICLDILYANRGGGWSPAMTISSCCLSLRSMLASATKKVDMYPSFVQQVERQFYMWVAQRRGFCSAGEASGRLPILPPSVQESKGCQLAV